jgi:uncharacterized membrane protein YfcA
MIPTNSIWLAILAFGAAIINGAVGYGFSSTVTPIAILWYSNKVLNPALVIVEVVVNIVLLTRERKHIAATWPRARPVIRTLLPGVVLGTVGLAYLAVNDVKVIVYVILLPLILLQLRGIYRPLKNEDRGGAVVGPGIGFLYALTTISGPPLALFLRNQGLSKNEFRCTIAQIRVAESSLTLGTYLAFDAFLGTNLVSVPALSLLPYLFIPVLIGIPLGTMLLGAVSPEFFRRFVMAVDGIFVSYGLSRVVLALKWVTSLQSDLLFGLLLLLVVILSLVALSRVVGGPFGRDVLRPEGTGRPDPPGPVASGAGEPGAPPGETS